MPPKGSKRKMEEYKDMADRCFENAKVFRQKGDDYRAMKYKAADAQIAEGEK